MKEFFLHRKVHFYMAGNYFVNHILQTFLLENHSESSASETSLLEILVSVLGVSCTVQK